MLNRTSMLPQSAVKPAVAAKATPRSTREPVVSQAWTDRLAAHLAAKAAEKAAALLAAQAAQAAQAPAPDPAPVVTPPAT